MYVPDTKCKKRLVTFPIIEYFPSSGASEPIPVLGIATFAIVGWERKQHKIKGTPLGTDTKACGTADPKEGDDPVFDCGVVWGFILEGVESPFFLLTQFSESDNPLAPRMYALIE